MKKIKADISLGATKKEREEEVTKIKKIQRLLVQFNLSAFAFDPGVRCLKLYNKVSSNGYGPEYVDFDGETWKWLEPLLKELVRWRKYGESFNINMKYRRKYGGA